ncbi:peptide ABC transporter permease [Marinobacterium nitratireducens]|uniref:Peptide ABC transporter permease n=1 Tax=Marinobacterium nitratireducens TaxID=518897 RepID=A0A917ZBU2_9GAMM|nr:ABC transporter permease [Marinobacterium nitratireducens]GGO79694.1 peptide ABC transporter permease [Marinobacterium nitratireducens]
MEIVRLAWKSLLNRRGSAALTILSIAISVMLLLGVDQIRSQVRDSFTSTVSGTDLIVGARSGQTQLLLYSVFHIGNATNNVDWQSYREIAAHPQVDWTIPLSLGDSHRGFRVVGTSDAFFEHYRYGRGQRPGFRHGGAFAGLHDAVIGAEVAERLGYGLGQTMVIAHGLGSTSFANHDDQPFRVVGVLERTGTPLDRSVLVSLEAIEAIHAGWASGTRLPGRPAPAAEDLTPKQITAFLVGLKSKVATFRLQRAINDYRKEPLLAILPGVALAELWSLMSVAERALLLVSACVVFSGLAGMLTVLLAGLRERRREIAILRSVGARPWQLLSLLTSEAALLTLCGCLAGMALMYSGLWAARPLVEQWSGLRLELLAPNAHQWLLLALVQGAGILIGLVPGWRAYRYSLAEGMTIRL